MFTPSGYRIFLKEAAPWKLKRNPNAWFHLDKETRQKQTGKRQGGEQATTTRRIRETHLT